jgi:transglutaminase-like putative cysteine protease
MNYQITHRTAYRYSVPVSLCQNLAHLTPREVPRQRCLQSVLTVHPEPSVLARRVDSFGNPETFFSVQQMHRELTVTANHQIEVWPPPEEVRPGDSPAWERVREQLAADFGPASLDAFQFVFSSRFAQPDDDLADYARESFTPEFTPERPLVEAAVDLTARIHSDFTYDSWATTASTPAKEVFTHRRGVCQDFAHLQIACLRSLGLAARYVSGYLPTDPPPGQPRLVGADATHAWVGVYCPQVGWIDLDPTNNLLVSDRHIVLAWGRDYDDVSPIKGVILGGGWHSMTASVDVLEAEEEGEATGAS